MNQSKYIYYYFIKTHENKDGHFDLIMSLIMQYFSQWYKFGVTLHSAFYYYYY